MLVNLLQLGRVSYEQGLALQRRLVDARANGSIGDTLVLLEHPPVLTLGRNATRQNILVSEATLAEQGVEVHVVNRGGDVTYHGPGQLVGYPVVDLRGDLPGKRGPHLGPVDFVRVLEEVLIRSCAEFAVSTRRIPGRTGVWTLAGGSIVEKKIAAIGIHVSRAITSHGFALNVTTDLRDFGMIVPCGIADREVTSLEIEAPNGTQPNYRSASDAVARHFGRLLERQVLAFENVEELLGVAASG